MGDHGDSTGGAGRRRFGILGPLEVTVADRRRLVPAGQSRVLLAALLLHAGQPVAADRLVEYLWDAPPRSARALLHTVVRRLRHVLADPGVVRTHGSAYLIEVAPGELDLDEFRALLHRAEQARADPAAERAQLRAALDLWRGPALVDVPSAALQRGAAAGLEDLRLKALSRRLEVDLALGRHAHVVVELRALTRDHPLWETPWTQLVTALYRCGRQAEALAAYRQVRRTLVDELGVEPGDELRRVHQAVLAGAAVTGPSPVAAAGPTPPAAPAAPAAPPRSASPTSPTPPTPPPERQLPPVAPDFAGRAADHGRLAGWLAPGPRVAVVVLWGLPGVGKTTLAVRVAHRLRAAYPGGQWFVPLGPGGPAPADVAETLADLLLVAGVPPASIPRGLPARAGMLRSRLADQRVLLVLDDAADPAAVEALLPGTPGCAVLVTSRRPLGLVAGARHHRLGPLPADDALALLGGILGAERVAAEPAAAREIVRFCGGLPLALRLAAARLGPLPTWRLRVLADRLRDEDRRLDELAVDGRTVRAGLELTYAALDEDERAAFRVLGTLPAGGFTAAALGRAAGGDGIHLAGRLTAAGLLDPVQLGAGGEPGYRPAGLVALYAAELARRADATAAAPRLLRAGQRAGQRAGRNADGTAFRSPPADAGGPAAARTVHE